MPASAWNRPNNDMAAKVAAAKPATAAKTVARTIPPKRKGQKALHFKEGGLHASTGTKPDARIPAARHAAARAGTLGRRAKAQEVFFENVLSHGKK